MQIVETAQSHSLQPKPLTRGRDPKSPNNYRRDIDGLRAIAVTSVVAYHAHLFPFHGGYVGVDIFFVISGYLIGSHVYKDVRHHRFSIAAFYQKRAKRILPALFVVLLFCYAAALLLLAGSELKAFGEYAVATIGSASNILAWLKSGYFAAGADQNPLLITWSLGVEEQFYILFPLLMLFFGRMGRRQLLFVTLAVTIASLGLSIFGLLRNPTATFYLLPTRAWELSAGILLAVYETDRPGHELYAGGRFANIFGVLGLGLLVYSVVMYTDNTPFPGLTAAVPVLGSVFVLISPSGWINRYLLSWRPFVFLGLVSYSWYLWHWPLLSFARIAADHEISKQAATLIAAISLGVAWLSYRFVEQPFRRSKTPVAPLLRRYAVLCVLMLIPPLSLVALRGWPQRFPRLSAIELQSKIKPEDRCLVGYGTSVPNSSSFCIPAADQRNAVALLGDSHASALGEALRQITGDANLRFEEMTKSSCPPLLAVTRLMPNHPGQAKECASFNTKSVDIVLRDPHVQTVVLAGYWAAPFDDASSGSRYQLTSRNMPATETESKDNLARGLIEIISTLRASGKRVLVIKDDPIFSFDPVRRIRWSFIPMRSVLARALMPGVNPQAPVSRSETTSPHDILASSILDHAAGRSATIFDLKENLCDPQACFFYADNHLLYADPQHLSMAGALKALQGLPLTAVSVSPGSTP